MLLNFRQPDVNQIQRYWQNFTSFFIVRHPFDRLVSAYRNKLENRNVHDGFYFQSLYGQTIVKKYRTRAHLEAEHIENIQKVEPTFKEFVKYLINTKIQQFDDHWKPMWLYCNICRFKYNFILKFENLEKEFLALKQYLVSSNINFPKNFTLQKINKDKLTQLTSLDIAKKYFNKLTKATIRQLYFIYQRDFELFNYDLHGFL